MLMRSISLGYLSVDYFSCPRRKKINVKKKGKSNSMRQIIVCARLARQIQYMIMQFVKARNAHQERNRPVAMARS
jgi:hypothetical protein